MSEGQRKMVGAIVVAASVAAAIGGFIGMKEGFTPHNARKAKLTATAGWGLEPAMRDRIFDALERDMKPVLDSQRFKDYQKQQLAAARAKGVKTDDIAFSKELGRMLVARGVPRLPDADMSALHDLKKKMVFASKRVCPCFWDPTTCTEADIMDGLARLTPPDLESWSRLSTAAALAELAASSAAPDTQADLQQGLGAIAEELPATGASASTRSSTGRAPRPARRRPTSASRCRPSSPAPTRCRPPSASVSRARWPTPGSNVSGSCNAEPRTQAGTRLALGAVRICCLGGRRVRPGRAA